MKKIVVNDTNVFIDLFNVGLLKEFFSLPWEVHTTSFIMRELQKEGQQEKVSVYKEKGLLHIPILEPKDMTQIGNMFQEAIKKSNLSIADCSVWYYAKVNNYVLLTGDRKLRSTSVCDGVEVHGMLYVFDCLVESGGITHKVAIEKLKLLYKTNIRLPKEELDKRLKIWEARIKDGGHVYAEENITE
jgi:rRNA-processing protein FCF1